MALAILIISGILFYSTSKHFPLQGIADVVNQNRNWVLIIASAFTIFSLYVFTISYDFATSFVLWVIAFITILSAVIPSVKVNTKWIWVWAGMALLLVIIDIM
ncbi:MAG: hypothetical protein AAFN93_07345 [Bacteroidota bacterium]